MALTYSQQQYDAIFDFVYCANKIGDKIATVFSGKVVYPEEVTRIFKLYKGGGPGVIVRRGQDAAIWNDGTYEVKFN